jgi:hypothetical protein
VEEGSDPDEDSSSLSSLPSVSRPEEWVYADGDIEMGNTSPPPGKTTPTPKSFLKSSSSQTSQHPSKRVRFKDALVEEGKIPRAERVRTAFYKKLGISPKKSDGRGLGDGGEHIEEDQEGEGRMDEDKMDEDRMDLD